MAIIRMAPNKNEKLVVSLVIRILSRSLYLIFDRKKCKFYAKVYDKYEPLGISRNIGKMIHVGRLK